VLLALNGIGALHYFSKDISISPLTATIPNKED
jgi:hypothetical protein